MRRAALLLSNRTSSSSSSAGAGAATTASSPIPSSPDPDIASQLFSILSHPGWPKSPALESLAPLITPLHVSDLLLSFPIRVHTAMSFFGWIARCPGFRHSVHSYGSLLRLLDQPRFHAQAERIRANMLHSCTTSEEARQALQAFFVSGSPDNGRPLPTPSLRCYNLLLISLAKFGMIYEMRHVYQQMMRDVTFPNIFTFNTMINACCKDGSLLEAKVYLSHLSRAGLDPDTYTFNSLISGYCKIKDFHGASRVLVTMGHKGCPRDEFSYTILIQGFCASHRIDEAFELLSQMESDGCRPNTHTLAVLIHGLCKEKRLADAEVFLSESSGRGLVPNVVCYNALVDGFCKAGMIDAASRIMESMDRNGCCPDIWTYTSLVDGLCRQEKLQDAWMLLNEAREKGTPNSIWRRVGLSPPAVSITCSTPSAIRCLMKKKQYEAQIEQLGKLQFQVHDQLITLQVATATTETIVALRKGEFFPGIPKIKYEGPNSKNPLSFKWYNAEEEILGKKMKDWTRFSVAFWHTFCGTGADPFGAPTNMWTWEDGTNSLAMAKRRKIR
ncbi:hypothetical protein J5N97_005551 [Dioscorea zingiberensis]|uniref:Pentatricopeptide repeat-containing protein n=1 Tax=Dioscorea zingiberensis TaxID=325984 RepID=A0A9D5HS02_9LILI|nr:hypothetical protein J5N97_005551 [Dioscorea zingiberensis]